MFDELFDLFERDRNRQRSRGGVRGLLDRLGDRDDDRSYHHRRDRDDDWDSDDHRPRHEFGRRRRELLDWDD